MTKRSMRRALIAWLLPPGWVIVPCRPSVEQEEAMCAIICSEGEGCYRDCRHGPFRKEYLAAIEAAPELGAPYRVANINGLLEISE